jgi:hypothetical protein
MTRTIITALVSIGFSLLLSLSSAWADQYVHGYYRNNGTYVQPYYRSSPDSSYNNNWSVSPNVNPYTGQTGTRAPTWNDQSPDSGFGLGNNSYGNSGLGRSNSGSSLFGDQPSCPAYSLNCP